MKMNSCYHNFLISLFTCLIFLTQYTIGEYQSKVHFYQGFVEQRSLKFKYQPDHIFYKGHPISFQVQLVFNKTTPKLMWYLCNGNNGIINIDVYFELIFHSTTHIAPNGNHLQDRTSATSAWGVANAIFQPLAFSLGFNNYGSPPKSPAKDITDIRMRTSPQQRRISSPKSQPRQMTNSRPSSRDSTSNGISSSRTQISSTLVDPNPSKNPQPIDRWSIVTVFDRPADDPSHVVAISSKIPIQDLFKMDPKLPLPVGNYTLEIKLNYPENMYDLESYKTLNQHFQIIPPSSSPSSLGKESWSGSFRRVRNLFS